MAWFKGTTTDWHDMLDIMELIGADEHMSAVDVYDGGSGYVIGDTIALSSGSYDFAPELEARSVLSGNTVATVASIVAGGTGYNIGDTVELVGGTSDVVAVLEVTAEVGNVVTGLQINNPGVYSVNPTGTVATAKLTGSGDDALTVTLTWNTAVTGIVETAFISHAGASTVAPTNPVASTATSGVGTGLKVDCTWLETYWETLMNYNPKVGLSAVVSAGGTGYSVDDIIIMDMGAGSPVEYTHWKVATLSGSAVATVTLDTEGYWAATPSNPAATTAHPTTPGGTGCTLTVTYDDFVDGDYSLFQHFIMHNTQTDVYVGIEASNYSPNDADVWKVFNLTGFSSLLTKFSEQPGYIDNDCYCSLHDGSFDYNLSLNDRRLLGIFNLGSGSSYNSIYLGFVDPFMTEDEYPYPCMSMGCFSAPQKYTYSGDGQGGIPNPGAFTGAQLGPGVIRNPGGVDEVVWNWYMFSGSQSLGGVNLSLTPIGNQYETPTLGEEDWYTSEASHSWYSIVQIKDVVASSQDNLKRLNNTYILVPIYVSDYDNKRFLGQLGGCFWFDNADAALSSGDRMWFGNVAYRVYQNVKKSNKNNFFCVKEG